MMPIYYREPNKQKLSSQKEKVSVLPFIYSTFSKTKLTSNLTVSPTPSNVLTPDSIDFQISSF